MNVAVDESHDYCKSLARRTARNFYYCFAGLPPERFRAMCALYAFMRLTDDLGDDPRRTLHQRRERLEAWRVDVSHALAGMQVEGPLFPAFCESVERFGIPHEYLFAVIDGVAMDLEPRQPETFTELSQYCYHVAGAVGLCCIHIWGFTDPRAVQCAVDCGTALQLTNILRDLREDAEMGRVYLPAEDLQRYQYSVADLSAHRRDDRFRRLMHFQVARAREFYRSSEQLYDYLQPAGRPVLRAMLRIYGGLLQEIERRNYDVFAHPVTLPAWRKLLVAADTVIRHRWLRHTNPSTPNAVSGIRGTLP